MNEDTVFRNTIDDNQTILRIPENESEECLAADAKPLKRFFLHV